MAAGYVYILCNPYFVGATGVPLLKIGGTARSAQARALELSAATGVPGQFSVVYQVATPDWQRLETAVHRALRAHRRVGEFFEVGQDEAIAVIAKLLPQTLPARKGTPDRGVVPTFRYEKKVAFVPTPFGSDVRVEGVALGTLAVAGGRLRYELLSEINKEVVVQVDLTSRPPHTDPSGIILADAQRRAAWLASILKRFTTPDFGNPDQAETRRISVNGLAIANLVQRRRRHGLFIRREMVEFDLEPVPCPRAPQIAESFGASATITPSDVPPYPELIFVPFQHLDIETSVRYYLLDQTLAQATFSRTCWCCHLMLLNCEIKLVLIT